METFHALKTIPLRVTRLDAINVYIPRLVSGTFALTWISQNLIRAKKNTAKKLPLMGIEHFSL